jgi:hypothetical protein
MRRRQAIRVRPICHAMWVWNGVRIWRFVDVLRRHSGDKAWWIGYLDSGASDIVFWDAHKVTLYHGWRYVFVLAGPDQAAAWRPAPGGQPNWKSTELPEVMFPKDRSWLVSFMWDDDWACIGGSEALIRDLLSGRVLAPHVRRVDIHQDATAGRLAGLRAAHSWPRGEPPTRRRRVSVELPWHEHLKSPLFMGLRALFPSRTSCDNRIDAAVAQPVERKLPKLEVAGSRPVRRLESGRVGLSRTVG